MAVEVSIVDRFASEVVVADLNMPRRVILRLVEGDGGTGRWLWLGIAGHPTAPSGSPTRFYGYVRPASLLTQVCTRAGAQRPPFGIRLRACVARESARSLNLSP